MVAVIKICSETLFNKKSYQIEVGQMTGFNMIRVFTERYLRTDYSAGFL